MVTTTNEGWVASPIVTSDSDNDNDDGSDDAVTVDYQNHKNYNINNLVRRNIHQSTIDPYVWQQYMVPPRSWWETIIMAVTGDGTNSNDDGWNPYTTDIALSWNFTINDTKIIATAERFMDLFDTTSTTTLSRQQHRSTVTRDAIIQNIASAMKQFTIFCDHHHHHHQSSHENSSTTTTSTTSTSSSLSFTMRLVCTYGGSRAGTKCPIWHVDHVPCRYIQTFYGPTCRFINHQRENDIIYRRIMTQQQEEEEQEVEEVSSDPIIDGHRVGGTIEFLSVQERNEILLHGIDDNKSCIGQANVGEGIILIGKLWDSWITTTTSITNITTSDDQDDENNRRSGNSIGTAAVHKSPHITSSHQGRILFTINVQ
jgi:hypothetical protein